MYKQISRIAVVLFLLFIFSNNSLFSQKKLSARLNLSSDGRYSYFTVDNDPMQTRIYTLKNGLKVYLSPNHFEPRIYTIIAARVGSKNDPSDNTGMAHYLEHMLFKGTDKFGSVDFVKEAPELNQLTNIFESYKALKDSSQRTRVYHLIDSISSVAAKYAIPNEYDKMMAVLGAKGTNANTTDERTAYINDIPANQMKNWLKIESERFSNPVFRLFHTELEAVYEEKNISLDNDGEKAWDLLMSSLFKNHPYGTQTTLGTVEHLKNPSLSTLYAYYHAYYVPNNMCVILAGDFDPDETIKLVDEYFGQTDSKMFPTFRFEAEDEITSPIYKTVVGPEPESLTIGYRLPAYTNPDMIAIKMFDMVLGNGKAGLIDLNLKQQQLVREPSNGYYAQTDYGVYTLSGMPREGQTLEQVKDLLLLQIEKIKKGEFDETMLLAIINDFTVQQLKRNERNPARCYQLLNTFTYNIEWVDYISELELMRGITKQQIIDIAKKYFTNNFVCVYKKTGPKEDVAKVVKPQITPLTLNRDNVSPFVKEIVESKSEAIKPQFVNFEKDIIKTKISNKAELRYLKNSENELFTMSYILDMGSLQDMKLPLAVNYFEFLGTDKMSAEDIKKQAYKLGCDFSVFSSLDRCYISISGLARNFKESVELFENLLHNGKPDKAALDNMIKNILRDRLDAKKDKYSIRNAIVNYASYGKINPVTHILSEKELQALNPEELIQRLKDLSSFDHYIAYYGQDDLEKVKTTLENLHQMPTSLKAIPQVKDFEPVECSTKDVFFTDYDMVQADISWFTRSMKDYNPKLTPMLRLYNQYFGGDMSSIVFQTLRESKALAYSCYSGYNQPSKKDKYYQNFGYIGTQADKIHDAITGMQELFDNFPRSEKNFEKAKEAIIHKIESERITRGAILFSYANAIDLGLNYDIRKDVFDQVPSITFDQLADFQAKYIKNKSYKMALIGSKDKIKMAELERYGKVHVLTLEDIFGY
ncbi:MAG: insulinase family protein [Candidatus Kapabacteria bacterium]|nr:insulinase family protein [Candidatus Kapabacteria bacterium]